MLPAGAVSNQVSAEIKHFFQRFEAIIQSCLFNTAGNQRQGRVFRGIGFCRAPNRINPETPQSQIQSVGFGDIWIFTDNADNVWRLHQVFQRWYYSCTAGCDVKRAFAVTQVPDPDRSGSSVFRGEFFDPFQTADAQVIIADGNLNRDVFLLQHLDQKVGKTRRLQPVVAHRLTVIVQLPAGFLQEGRGVIEQFPFG